MIDLEDCHVCKIEKRTGRNGAPLILICSAILHPDLTDQDPNLIAAGLAARYLKDPITCDYAEHFATVEMQVRAKVRADGREPASMLKMVFMDPGLGEVGIGPYLINCTVKPVRFRQGGRA